MHIIKVGPKLPAICNGLIGLAVSPAQAQSLFYLSRDIISGILLAPREGPIGPIVSKYLQPDPPVEAD